jgi:hypothetical protein
VGQAYIKLLFFVLFCFFDKIILDHSDKDCSNDFRVTSIKKYYLALILVLFKLRTDMKLYLIFNSDTLTLKMLAIGLIG